MPVDNNILQLLVLNDVEKISKITDDTVGTVLKYFEEISLLTDVTWLFLFRGWNLECLWTKKDENVFTEFAPEN